MHRTYYEVGNKWHPNHGIRSILGERNAFTCMGSHVCAVMAGLAKALPAHWTDILALFLP